MFTRLRVRCPVCASMGQSGDCRVCCPVCEGRGVLPEDDGDATEVTCWACHGQGVLTAALDTLADPAFGGTRQEVAPGV